MAVFGSVKFSRVKTQYYTGGPIIPNGDDIFVITDDDFEIYGNGVEITFNQLQDYCPRPLTIECLNNTEVGIATINIIDNNSDGQFSTSGTFEIVDNSLIGIYNLKHFKNKYDSELNSKFAKVTDIPDTSNFVTNDVLNGKGYLTSAPVSSVNSKTGAVSLNYGDVKALPGFSVHISHQSAGNPRLVKFATVNYSSYTSNYAAYFKLSAMSCHGNGVSYQFLEDIVIGCTYTGDITCNILKTCQIEIGNVDSIARFCGDVFYTHDTTNKVVDFYILCGQWASSQFTPLTAIGSTGLNGVVQHSGNAVYYSSGDKVWANGCGSTFARTTDLNIAEAVISDSGNITQTILPNTKYNFTGTLTSLTLNMGQPINGIKNTYSFIFKTSKTGTAVTLNPYSGYILYGMYSLNNLDTSTYYRVEIEDNIAMVSPVFSKYLIACTAEIEGSSTAGSVGGAVTVVDSDGDALLDVAPGGETCSIVATPNTNYTLHALTLNNSSISNNYSSIINANWQIHAKFLGNTTTITYTLPSVGLDSVSVTCNGTAISSGATVRFGDVISVIYTATSGYTISRTSTGLSSTGSGYITAANPTITVTATASTT